MIKLIKKENIEIIFNLIFNKSFKKKYFFN